MRLKNAYKKAKKGSIIKSSSIPGSHVVGMPNGGYPPKKKLQWYQQPGTMEEKLRKYGTTGMPLHKSNSEGLSELLNVPQKLVTQAVTGKYQTPGEALEKAGVLQNKTDLDVIDFVTDPLNYIPLFKAGKLATLSKPQQLFNSTTSFIKNADNLSDVINSRTINSPSSTKLVEAKKPTMRNGGKYLPTAVSQELAKKPSAGLKEAYKRRKKI